MAKSETSSAPFSYEGLDRVIHEKARLGLLTSLMAHPKGLAFGDLKQLCGLTDGNLSRHLLVLQEAGLVGSHQGLRGQPPAHHLPPDQNRPAPLSRLPRRARKTRSRRGQGRGDGRPPTTQARPSARLTPPLFCKEAL